MQLIVALHQSQSCCGQRVPRLVLDSIFSARSRVRVRVGLNFLAHDLIPVIASVRDKFS